jgi:hypothetical protein
LQEWQNEAPPAFTRRPDPLLIKNPDNPRGYMLGDADQAEFGHFQERQEGDDDVGSFAAIGKQLVKGHGRFDFQHFRQLANPFLDRYPVSRQVNLMARCHLVQNVLKRIDQFEQADADHLIIFTPSRMSLSGLRVKVFSPSRLRSASCSAADLIRRYSSRGLVISSRGPLPLLHRFVPAEASWI